MEFNYTTDGTQVPCTVAIVTECDDVMLQPDE